MATGGNGSCTWTWDGNYWTCVNQCADGKECNDIVTTSGVRSLSDPISAADPTVQSLLPTAVAYTDGATGKHSFKIPDPLFRQVARLHHRKIHPTANPSKTLDLTKTSAAEFSGTPLPITVVVDCV